MLDRGPHYFELMVFYLIEIPFGGAVFQRVHSTGLSVQGTILPPRPFAVKISMKTRFGNNFTIKPDLAGDVAITNPVGHTITTLPCQGALIQFNHHQFRRKRE
ncbi:hypothetical protein ZHAS_00012820 [Anopheles sinensis]|uniref:Uncharacterized protein n=1 Tax=Anopheles sinensis TaxID=74873 RepID=A0A084W3W4_ANOSI|nr:hypothetical protein ZHAS_00012820 [Anopheles sinensis]